MSHLHCSTIYSKEIIKGKELFIKKNKEMVKTYYFHVEKQMKKNWLKSFLPRFLLVATKVAKRSCMM